MKESVTYQAIVEEGVVKGRLKQARLMLVLLGEEEFGKPPGPRVQATIEAFNSLDQLEQLARRTRHVRSWDELLADVSPPAPWRRTKEMP